MKTAICTLLLSLSVSTKLLAGILDPGSYEECLIDKMDEAKTNITANSLASVCKKYDPISSSETHQPYFFPDTFEDCISKYIGTAKSEKGAIYIRYACVEMTAVYNQDDCIAYLMRVRELSPDVVKDASNKELYIALLGMDEATSSEDFNDSCR